MVTQFAGCPAYIDLSVPHIPRPEITLYLVHFAGRIFYRQSIADCVEELIRCRPVSDGYVVHLVICFLSGGRCQYVRLHRIVQITKVEVAQADTVEAAASGEYLSVQFINVLGDGIGG